MMDITFDRDFAELKALCRDGRILATEFLALMEPESEETFEDAFEQMEQWHCELVFDLPPAEVSGETALQLRREAEWVASGAVLTELEEQNYLRLCLEELAQIPAAGDPAVLAQELLEGKDVREQLTSVLLSRVVEAAKGYTGRGVLLMDLIQEGSMGLWQGLYRYTGGDIEDFCDRWIHQYMEKLVVWQARTLGLGQKLRQGLSDYVDVDQKLLTELGRNPTVEEIAQEMHVSAGEAATYEAMLQSARERRRVEQAREPQPEQEEEEQAVEDTAYFQTRQAVAELMSGLSEQESKLLSLRYGLEGGLPLNPAETGRRLGLTAKEVVEQEAAILAKLRN